MPFTFVHPAAIVPFTFLSRRWSSVTGLAVGSMMPDMEYFLRMRYEGDHGHTLAGLFYFDLPIGVMLTFVFHGLVRDALVSNLPKVLRERLWHVITFDWTGHFRLHWAIVLGSILLGAITHIGWDVLSHGTGPLPGLLHGMDNTFQLFNKHWSKLYVMELLSSLIGAVILLATFLMMPRTSADTGHASAGYWVVLVLIGCLVLYVRFLGVDLTPKWIDHVVVSAISAMLASLCLTPWALSLLRLRSTGA